MCGRCNCDREFGEELPSQGGNQYFPERASINDLQPINSNRPPENETNQKPSDEEEQFDRMFSDWEAGFESWKCENVNNPDQVLQRFFRQHFSLLEVLGGL